MSMGGGNTERAQLLLQQGRFEMAALELRRTLMSDPSDSAAHALLGLALNQLGEPKEALIHAGEAIRNGADRPFPHYAMAFILAGQNKYRKAEASVSEALRINPWDADCFDLLARIRLDQANWRGALEAADSGLAVQADHIGCINARGRALIKLQRHAEALETVDSALRLEPDNASSHANKGWTLVESGDPSGALVHFREALRLAPNMEWARQGMVTALKAKNPFYRLMLTYFLWTARLPRPVRTGIIVGLWVAAQVNVAVSDRNPALTPYCRIGEFLYVGFCFLTWTSDPISNALLRFNQFGRCLLTRRQIVQSNWVAGSLVAAILAFGVYLLRPRDGYLVLAIGGMAVVYLSALVGKLPKRATPRIESAILALAALLIAVWAALAGL